MRLIDHWQKAHRLFSVQVAVIGVVFWSALGGLWIMWPVFAERLPIPVYIGVGLLLSSVVGIGRYVHQNWKK
jgi:hypothetical protein